MLSSIFLLLTQAPFPFEVNRGFSLEPFGAFSSLDSDDAEGYSFGGRASYVFADQTDAFFTGEISSAWVRSLDAGRNKILMEAQVLAYEIYNPWAMRVGLGAGAERRLSEWNPLGVYRIGLGHYVTSRVGIFGDFMGRVIKREKWRNPLEVSVSVQTIW